MKRQMIITLNRAAMERMAMRGFIESPSNRIYGFIRSAPRVAREDLAQFRNKRDYVIVEVNPEAGEARFIKSHKRKRGH